MHLLRHFVAMQCATAKREQIRRNTGNVCTSMLLLFICRCVIWLVSAGCMCAPLCVYGFVDVHFVLMSTNFQFACSFFMSTHSIHGFTMRQLTNQNQIGSPNQFSSFRCVYGSMCVRFVCASIREQRNGEPETDNANELQNERDSMRTTETRIIEPM